MASQAPTTAAKGRRIRRGARGDTNTPGATGGCDRSIDVPPHRKVALLWDVPDGESGGPIVRCLFEPTAAPSRATTRSPRAHEEPVPLIRPFRALRYSPESVGDLAAVVAPPYDVLSRADRDQLRARNERNVVRLDAPDDEAGDRDDERYRRAARTLAAWRSDGTFHKEPRP